MSNIPDSAPINDLHDALAHTEANYTTAVTEALQHGGEHLKARAEQRAAAAAAYRARANANPAGGQHVPSGDTAGRTIAGG